MNKRKSAPICVHNNYFRKEPSFVCLFCTSKRSCENARMYDFVEKSMQSELWQVYKNNQILSEYAKTTHPKTRPKTTQPKLPTAGNLCLMNVLPIYRSLVIATTSCNRTHSGFFDLKHCYQRASADNISRKFGPRSGPTKCLKLIKPDGFPDFFYHTF